MAEEVPTPREKQYPLWKEYSLFEKAWIIIADYIPYVVWVVFGLIVLHFGSD